MWKEEGGGVDKCGVYVLEQNFEDRPVAENIFEEQETQIKTHFMSHKVQHLFSLS